MPSTKYEYIERNPTKLYKDLNIAFTKHPVSSDVTIKSNEESIKQSLKNLMLLGRDEKPFHPEIGGGLYDLLFENYDEVGTEDLLRTRIAGLVNRYEPRIELEGVDIDFIEEQNAVSITLYYVIVTTLVKTSAQIYLKVTR